MCPRNFVYDNHSIVYGDKKLGKKSKCTLCLLLIYYLSVPNTPFIACSAIVEMDLLSISPLLVGTILSFVNRGPGGDTARRKRLPPSSVLLFLVLLCGCQLHESGYPVVLPSVEFQWPLCRVLSIEFQWHSCYSMSSATPNKVASQYILLAYPQRVDSQQWSVSLTDTPHGDFPADSTSISEGGALRTRFGLKQLIGYPYHDHHLSKFWISTLEGQRLFEVYSFLGCFASVLVVVAAPYICYSCDM